MMQSEDLNLRHLFAAVTTSKSDSISNASESLHISQPALTHAIHKLEGLLGQALFVRSNRGIQTTPAGRLFLSHVQDGLGILAAAAQKLRQSERLAPLITPERQISNTQIRAFLAVLRTGGYSLAARSLNFSQPSIYRAVQELQFVLGVPLFASDGTLMRAPDGVQHFADQIRLALASIQSGIDELNAIDKPGTGRICVGSLPLARSALLPNVLASFGNTHPRVAITVVEGQFAELVSSLRDGSIDMFFGALRRDIELPDLRQQALFMDELYVVGRSGHPLAGKTPTPVELTAYPWIVPMAHSPMRSIWEDFLSRGNAPFPAQQVECGSVLLARGLMCNGDWLGLMSRHQFALEHQYNVLKHIGPPLPDSDRPIGVTMRRTWRPTLLQKAFLDLAEEISKSISRADGQDTVRAEKTRSVQQVLSTCH
ncbi:HTH-type transcriptional regulator HdfR [Paraburkholderia aspalathi]|uniref:LysR family transcriptional regulator n=1 Tax=Paraburkholderia aspalathi TaxID=1324617 RepID=UPI00190A1D3F|nr:LysR family transcriptional regulator [Paraburkholderia aspalathi]MBK3843026.1 LysR family transcriptional regulator [Paraburkholderia aspalathi]CAE6843328.1 HTH-type transcriptional regulator HdfR [Paraburkholderia aspalathi]